MKKYVTLIVGVGLAIGGMAFLSQRTSTFRSVFGPYLPGGVANHNDAGDRIRSFEGQLQSNLKSFEVTREKVQTQLTDQTRSQRERENELLGVLALLARFKDEYAVGVGPGGFPRQVLGRTYSKDAIESQVELLLKRRAELEQQTTHQARVNEKLQKSLSELDQRIGTTKTHLDSMPTYVTLVETHALTGESDKAVAGLESCLASNEALLTAAVRDARELMKVVREEKETSAQAINVQQFLMSPSTPAATPVKPQVHVPGTVTATTGSQVPCPATSQELLSQIKAILDAPSTPSAN